MWRWGVKMKAHKTALSQGGEGIMNLRYTFTVMAMTWAAFTAWKKSMSKTYLPTMLRCKHIHITTITKVAPMPTAQVGWRISPPVWRRSFAAWLKRYGRKPVNQLRQNRRSCAGWTGERGWYWACSRIRRRSPVATWLARWAFLRAQCVIC